MPQIPLSDVNITQNMTFRKVVIVFGDKIKKFQEITTFWEGMTNENDS